VSYKAFGQHMIQKYRETILSIEDLTERAEAMRPIWDYVDSVDAAGVEGKALKSVVSTMKSAREQFTTLVSKSSTPQL
jgi:hypothetical protein